MMTSWLKIAKSLADFVQVRKWGKLSTPVNLISLLKTISNGTGYQPTFPQFSNKKYTLDMLEKQLKRNGDCSPHICLGFLAFLCKSDYNRWTFKINASRRFGDQFPYLGDLYHQCTTTTWNVRVEKSGQAQIRLQSPKKIVYRRKRMQIKTGKVFHCCYLVTSDIIYVILQWMSVCPTVLLPKFRNFFFPEMRLNFLMFIPAVCFLFLLSLPWS